MVLILTMHDDESYLFFPTTFAAFSYLSSDFPCQTPSLSAVTIRVCNTTAASSSTINVQLSRCQPRQKNDNRIVRQDDPN